MSSPKLAATLPEYLLQLSLLNLITRSAPFTHTKTVPLHALSHLVSDYIHLLASTAQASAELAGRSQVSVWDVGSALEEFGAGGVRDLLSEVEIGPGGDGQGAEEDRIQQLSAQLTDCVDAPPAADPIARLSFQRLTKADLALLKPTKAAKAEAQPAPSSSSSHQPSSEDEEEDEVVPPTEDVPEELKAQSSDFLFDAYPPIEQDAQPPLQQTVQEDGLESLWSDPSAIPSFVPPFLPPFPGYERQRELPEAGRRKREREAERDAQADRVWTGGARANDAPWEKAIAYSKSILAQMHAPDALPPLSPTQETAPDGSARRRRRVRSVSPPAVSSSSLSSYAEAAATVLQGEPQWERKANHERRVAASKIGQPVDLITGDSLFGLVPLNATRSAQLSAGFLQDGLNEILHPFNTQLPHTISHAVPIHPSPHSLLLGPPSHNRMPLVMSGLVSQLGGTGSKNLSVFTRMLRMAPPSGLLPNGEAANFEYIPHTTIVDLAVEWNERSQFQPLPNRGTEAAGPIKLRLGGRGGSATPAASGATPAAGGWTPALSLPPEELPAPVEEAAIGEAPMEDAPLEEAPLEAVAEEVKLEDAVEAGLDPAFALLQSSMLDFAQQAHDGAEHSSHEEVHSSEMEVEPSASEDAGL